MLRLFLTFLRITLLRCGPEALPASLSEPLTTGLLRGELGFDAVVLTDDLDMKAVAHRWTPAEIAAKAAGAPCIIASLAFDVSPDGEMVAYSWSGVDDDNYDIYVKQRNTETPGVGNIECMLGIDKGSGTAGLLHFCNHVQC